MAPFFRNFLLVGSLQFLVASLAHAESFGPHFDYFVLTTVYPFLAFLIGALIYLLLWHVLWYYRVWSLIVLILVVAATLASVATGAFITFPWYASPLAWIAPLAVWTLFNKWLRRRLAKLDT